MTACVVLVVVGLVGLWQTRPRRDHEPRAIALTLSWPAPARQAKTEVEARAAALLKEPYPHAFYYRDERA